MFRPEADSTQRNNLDPDPDPDPHLYLLEILQKKVSTHRRLQELQMQKTMSNLVLCVQEVVTHFI